MIQHNKRTTIQNLIANGKTPNEISQITGWHLSTIRYYRDSNCPKKQSARVAEHRRRVKRKALAYSGSICLHCNYNKYDGSLIFHHLDPMQKDITISSGNSRSYNNIKAEIDKCILLCHNCHSEYHGGIWQITDEVEKQTKIRASYIDQPLWMYADNPNDRIIRLSHKTQIINAPSKDELLTMLTTASIREIAKRYECSAHVIWRWCKTFNIDITQAPSKIPSYKILETLIKEFSAAQLANKFNVSDNTIGKWLMKYKIINPRRR